MSRRMPLDPASIVERLAGLPSWRSDGISISVEYQFEDFLVAFSFLTRVALAQVELDHHGEITTVYSRVSFRLWTHDVGGVTELDFTLAHRIHDFATQARANHIL